MIIPNYEINEINSNYSVSKKHNYVTLKIVLRLAPIVAIFAAITFTIARLFGFFNNTSFVNLISFDIICCAYFPIAYAFYRIGKPNDGELNLKAIKIIKIILVLLIFLQWNLITYIFPTSDFWGYAPLFVIVIAFFFDSKLVLLCSGGIILSIYVSWIIKGEQLLPTYNNMFSENLILRCVAIVVTLLCIYLLTRYGEIYIGSCDKYQKKLTTQNVSLKSMNIDTIRFAADIVEKRDKCSGTHIKRVEQYTAVLAKKVQSCFPEYNLTDSQIEKMSSASVLHDVGKIYIPDSILLKEGKLTDDEFDIIKKHTIMGAEIARTLPAEMDDEFKQYCYEICLCHHERWNGKGYPNKFSGDDIPISAQITAVADCFDALTSDRPYRSALSVDVAYKMIISGQCGAFSERMMDCFKECYNEFVSIYRKL